VGKRRKGKRGHQANIALELTAAREKGETKKKEKKKGGVKAGDPVTIRTYFAPRGGCGSRRKDCGEEKGKGGRNGFSGRRVIRFSPHEMYYLVFYHAALWKHSR